MPINLTNTVLTPLSAKLNVQKLDLALTGFVDPSAGFGGLVDLDGDLVSDGASADLKGTLHGEKLKLVAGGSPATVPVSVEYATTYDLKSGAGNLTQGDIHIGKALAHLTGSYNASGDEPTGADAVEGAKAMPAPDLEGALPAAGVTLPSGASLQAGSLDLALAINGPVDKLVITGPVDLSNAKLGGYDLKSKLGALSSFTGLGGGSGPDTVVQSLHADLRQDPGGAHAANLKVVVESIGTITGDANVSASQQLDCKMSAALSGALGSVASPVALLGKAGSSSGSIPFTITGTASNPVFRPDLGSVAGNLAKGLGGLGSTTGKGVASSAKGVLGGIFGKKNSN